MRSRGYLHDQLGNMKRVEDGRTGYGEMVKREDTDDKEDDKKEKVAVVPGANWKLSAIRSPAKLHSSPQFHIQGQ